jgi:hypothetical protein
MWPPTRLACLAAFVVLAAVIVGSNPEPTPAEPVPPPLTAAPASPATRPPAHRLIYPAHGRLDAALAQILPVVRMRGVRLEDAIDQLRDQTGINLFVDWNRLGSEETPGRELGVDVDVRGMSLADALTLVLRSAGDGIDWGIEGGVVVVTAAYNVVRPTRVYDVRDIIDGEVARRVALEGPPATFPAENERRAKVAREECTTRLKDLLIASVEPKSWNEVGGSIGSVQELNGRLIITQTWQNHRELEALLDGLRRDRLDPYPTTRAAAKSDTEATPAK